MSTAAPTSLDDELDPALRRTGQGIVWTFGGQVASLVVVLALTPIQITGMGAERYGLLALMAATVGYLSVLDIGSGWAVSRYLPALRASGDEERTGEILGTAAAVTAVLGTLAGSLMWASAPELARDVLHTSDTAVNDATIVLRGAAVALPLVLLQGVVTGACRAAGLFRTLAVVSPVEVVVVNVAWALASDQDHAVLVVVTTQVVATVALTGWRAGALVRCGGWPTGSLRPTSWAMRAITSFGAFTTVSRLGMATVSSLDKLALASVVPTRDLVLYSIPFSLAQRITILCSAAAGVLFPGFSHAAAAGTGAPADLERRIAQVAVLTAGLAAALAAGGAAFLDLWIGGGFGGRARVEVIALAIGFGILSLGSLDRVVSEARGVVAKPAYMTIGAAGIGLAALLLSAPHAGTAGAALAIGAALASIGIADVVIAARSVGEGVAHRLGRRLRWWPTMAACASASAAVGAAVDAPNGVRLAGVVLPVGIVTMIAFGRATRS